MIIQSQAKWTPYNCLYKNFRMIEYLRLCYMSCCLWWAICLHVSSSIRFVILHCVLNLPCPMKSQMVMSSYLLSRFLSCITVLQLRPGLVSLVCKKGKLTINRKVSSLLERCPDDDATRRIRDCLNLSSYSYPWYCHFVAYIISHLI